MAAIFSIGRWIDEDGDGKYDVLRPESRYFKGLGRSTRAACHWLRQSVDLQERFFIDK